MKKRIISLVLCFAMCLGMVSMLAGCGGKTAPEAFVIATELLDGLFNPFYYTAANDGNIVALTQISLIGAKYENDAIDVAYGENEAVVAKDYEIVENDDGTMEITFAFEEEKDLFKNETLTYKEGDGYIELGVVKYTKVEK